jgi:hypothetical protein
MDMLNSTPTLLHSLNLGCNDIWDEGGKAIGEMLKFNKNVYTHTLNSHLSLTNSHSFLSFISSFSHNNTFKLQLRILELGAGNTYWHDNNLGYQSAIAIAEVHPPPPLYSCPLFHFQVTF